MEGGAIMDGALHRLLFAYQQESHSETFKIITFNLSLFS